MFLPLQEIVTKEVPRLLEQAYSQGTTSDLSAERVLGAVNAAYFELHQKVIKTGRTEFLAYTNAAVSSETTGLLDAVIPARADRLLCLSVRSVGDTVPKAAERNAITSFVWAGKREPRILCQPAYRREFNSIYVLPETRSGNYYRMWYVPRAPRLHYSQVANTQTSSTTALHLATTPDVGSYDHTPDIYVGSKVYIYSGTGAGQMARIASVNSSHVATLSPINALSGDALTTALSTDSYYSIEPHLDEFGHLLAVMAARNGYKKMDASPFLAEFEMRYMEQFLDWLQPQDAASPTPIQEGFGDDLGLDRGPFLYGL